MPDWFLPSLAIASPFIAGVVVWVGKTDSRRVEARLDKHEALDANTHENMEKKLDSIESKLDRLIERTSHGRQ